MEFHRYSVERSTVELLLYEGEKVIAKIQVGIPEEVNEKNLEQLERKYAEVGRQHSLFQKSWIRDVAKSEKKLRKEI